MFVNNYPYYSPNVYLYEEPVTTEFKHLSTRERIDIFNAALTHTQLKQTYVNGVYVNNKDFGEVAKNATIMSNWVLGKSTEDCPDILKKIKQMVA